MNFYQDDKSSCTSFPRIHINRRIRVLVQAVTAILALVLSSIAVAAPTNLLTPEEDDEWNYAIAFPVVWAPAVIGDIDIEGGNNIGVEVGFNDILSNLSAGFMGSMSATHGDWGVGLSVNYLNVKTDTSIDGFNDPIFGLPVLAPHDVDVDMDLSTNDLTLRYRVHPSIRLTAGVRHFYTKIRMDFTPTGAGIGLDRQVELINEHMYDFIFGFAADHWFDDKWGVAASVDTRIFGDNDRSYNAQVFGVYRINDLHNVWIGYRHLAVINDAVVDGLPTEIAFYETGPAVGWYFTFN